MTAFVKEARNFARENRSRFIFRVLQLYTRCNDEQLDYLIEKIYCSSIPSSHNRSHTILDTYLGLLLFPLYALMKKKWVRGRERKTDINFETTDYSYFSGRFSLIYASLIGSKRITPRDRESFPGDLFPDGEEFTDPIFAQILPGQMVLLFIVALVTTVPLIFFCRCSLNLAGPYVTACSMYSSVSAYFRRYPCRHFITYADDSNHPSRYIAFRQRCDGKMVVIQNGERVLHPTWAFGMTDAYLTFGQAHIDMIKELGYRVRDAFPVGSLALNQHYEMVMKSNGPILFEVLYIDNGSNVPPLYGGLNEKVARSEEIIFSHLNTFKSRHRQYRIGYQLRNYGDAPEQKSYLLSLLKRYFTEDIEILENGGTGESYLNILRSRLVVTFQSTMGFEAFMLGKRTLFVNYSGYESETMCSDRTYQIENDTYDYGLFEERVLDLLETDGAAIPPFAVERHFAFDGQVQKRIATAIGQLLQE